MSRLLVARALDAAVLAPFGEVTACPPHGGATAVAGIGAPVNLRPAAAQGRLAWFAVAASVWPLRVRQMERHRFSSQTFVPCGAGDWLVLVAPHDAEGGPDMARAEALVAHCGQAVTYRPDVWHHPLTALREASFAVLTCLAGDADDEEFRTLAESIVVQAPR